MTATPGDRAAMTPYEVFELKERRVLDYDMGGQADLFAEDGVMEFPFAPPGVPRRLEGREAIRTVLGTAAERARQAGVRLEWHGEYTVHQTGDPEVIVVEFEARGRGADERVHRVPYLQVLRVRDGQIVHFRDYWSIETAAPLWGEAAAAALQAGR
jgi:ketosteroid isomerase-like protein